MKIFGIGLPKTGTTSLNAALKILGLRALHYPHDRTTVRELRRGQYRLSVLEQYDALTDIPVPAIFAQLDRTYPASKFVMTVRDVDSWLESCRRAWFNQRRAVPRRGSAREFYRTLLYGCNAFSEARFRWVHRAHATLVRDFFSGEKAKQLLTLDVSDTGGWGELCDFLGLDIPPVPFPHRNRHAVK